MSQFQFSHRTQVVFGVGVWKQALTEARRLGASALLVTGEHSLARLGIEQELLAEAVRLELGLVRFLVPREPDTILADAAAAVARSSGAQLVLAVGGGSALDVGKAAALLATNAGSARDYLEGLPSGGGKTVSQAPLPIVCVPLTAGTGSEVTKNSVLQVPDLQIKRSMRSEQLFPHAAYVDPSLSARAPHLVRAGTGFDALTHLVEAFCSKNASPFTDALARDGIPRAARALAALAGGNAGPLDAEELALASTLGGVCLANAGLGAAHGLIAPLGGLYPNVPHGAGLSCLLPATLAVNAAAAATDTRVSARFAELAGLLGYAEFGIAEVPARLTELRRSLGLPALRHYGNIDVTRVCAGPSGSLKTNPVTLDSRQLSSILEQALAE